METNTWADYIFGGDVEGIVYAGLLEKGHLRPVHYTWPSERQSLLNFKKNSPRGDLYFCPSLFSERSGKKSKVIGSWVSWVDLDTEVKEHPDVSPAGLIVGSGSKGRTHRYWRADTFQSVELTEERNLYLQQSFGADQSGWDANQLLRIPNTLNHKTKPPQPVKVRTHELGTFSIPAVSLSTVYGNGNFELFPFEEVLLSKPLPKKAADLFIKGGTDRSTSLTHFALLLAEAGYTDDERYSLLTHADVRWGKFKLRDDKELQLTLIIQRTRLEASAIWGEESGKRKLFSRRQLRDSPKAKISWVYEGIISTGGFAVIAGKQGVGKSQLALQLGSDAVLKRPFLGIKQTSKIDEKVCWFSLEMTQDQLAATIFKQTAWVNDDSEEEKILEDRLLYDAVGHAIYLEEAEGQEELEAFIREQQPTGIVIDSLSAAVKTSLKDDMAVRKVFDWIDKIRAKYGVWVVLITHPRKMPPGVAKGYESTVDDVYGDSIITQRPSSVCLLSAIPGGQFEFRYIKARSSAIGEPICLGRSDSLTFNLETPRVFESKATVSTKVRSQVEEVFADTDNLLGD